MRLNRYNWQDFENSGQGEPVWLPELLLPRRESGKPALDEGGLGLFWEQGDSRVVLVEKDGCTLAMVGGVTGLELLQQWQVDGVPEWFCQADEYHVMLANPFSEELKRQVYYRSTDPRGLADKMHAEIVSVIGFLRSLVADGRELKLRFYNGVAGLSQWMYESIESFTAIREWSSRFHLAWHDSKVGEFDFASDNLVFLHQDGRISRRVDFANPPKLPYFDCDGALVVSI